MKRDWYEGWSFPEFNGILIIWCSKTSAAITRYDNDRWPWIKPREIHPSIHLSIYPSIYIGSLRMIRGGITMSMYSKYEVTSNNPERSFSKKWPVYRASHTSTCTNIEFFSVTCCTLFFKRDPDKQTHFSLFPLSNKRPPLLPVQRVQPIHPIFRNYRGHVRIIGNADARNDLPFLVPLNHRVTTRFAANYSSPPPCIYCLSKISQFGWIGEITRYVRGSSLRIFHTFPGVSIVPRSVDRSAPSPSSRWSSPADPWPSCRGNTALDRRSICSSCWMGWNLSSILLAFDRSSGNLRLCSEGKGEVINWI